MLLVLLVLVTHHGLDGTLALDPQLGAFIPPENILHEPHIHIHLQIEQNTQTQSALYHDVDTVCIHFSLTWIISRAPLMTPHTILQ